MFLEEYVLDKQNKLLEWERQMNAIGKYPPGFRHFENFVNYRVVFPDASIEDYMKEMNREVTYQEFLAIMKSSILEDSKQYRFKFDFYNE